MDAWTQQDPFKRRGIQPKRERESRLWLVLAAASLAVCLAPVIAIGFFIVWLLG